MTFPEKVGPSDLCSGRRALVVACVERRSISNSTDVQAQTLISGETRAAGKVVILTGRTAQTMLLLIESGQAGMTSGDASVLGWARRTSAYIHRLRSLGFEITTTRETTSDGSCIGRYHLIDTVDILFGGAA